MSERPPTRLTRLLALVTYLQRHGAVTFEALATHFNVSVAQILDDINLLWVSGMPGHSSNDLIDFSADDYERGVVHLTEDQAMSTPIPLSRAEANALLVGLQTLLAAPGLVDAELVESTYTAIQLAAVAAGADPQQVSVEGSRGLEGRLLSIRQAIREQRSLRLGYISADDRHTERRVDPWRLAADGAHIYLYSWCHRASAPRMFRIDRIESIGVTDQSIEYPEASQPEAQEDPLRAPARWTVRLTLHPAARRVAESYRGEVVAELEGGWFVVDLHVHTLEWVTRLVLGLGSDVRWIEPPEIAQHIASAAERALAAHP